MTRAGFFLRAAGHFMEREGIDEHILMYCLAGRGWVRIEGKTTPIGAGTIAVCPAGKAHAYGADADDPWTIRWVHFRGAGCDDLFTRMGLSAAVPSRAVGLADRQVEALRDCCRSLYGGYGFPLLFRSSTALLAFFAAVLSIDMDAPGPENAGSIRPEGASGEWAAGAVVRWMLEHLDETPSLDDLAAMAGYSRYHFCRVFRLRSGYPPLEYMARLKIQRACELLETTGLSLSRISEDLGFGTPYYFSTVFKRIVGMPPSEFRIKHREQDHVEAERRC